MHSMLMVALLFVALAMQDVHSASNETHPTMTKRARWGNTMIVDSDVHDNVMNSRQVSETSNDTELSPKRRAFFINGGTGFGNKLNIDRSKNRLESTLQGGPTKSKGFFVDGQPLVVKGNDGTPKFNSAVNRPPRSSFIKEKSVYSRNIIDNDNTTEATMKHRVRDFHIKDSNVYKNQMNSRDIVDELNTSETPKEQRARGFIITNSEVYKNQMNSRDIVDDLNTSETPKEHRARDFHISSSNVYRNTMNSRDIVDDLNTSETPKEHGARDFRISDSNVYKNQMNSRGIVDDLNTSETPKELDTRDFYFSNNNMHGNQNNTRLKNNAPPLPKKSPK